MIAFDLDGVFIPDIAPDLWDTEEYKKVILKIRSEYLVPIYQPNFPYIVITGRPFCDKEDTLSWFNKFFKVKPTQVYHDNLDLTKSPEYKADVLNSLPIISLYVESCGKQVDIIKSLVTRRVRILTFQNFLHIGRREWGKFI